jgi:excisionase family DNA binding protein
MKRLITQRDAAYLLSVSIRTIENYRKTGKLQTIKLGYRSIRIDRHEVEKMIEVEKWQIKNRQGSQYTKVLGTSFIQKTDAHNGKAYGQMIRRSQ